MSASERMPDSQPRRTFFADEPTDRDLLDFEPYARTLASLLVSPQTEPPLTLGVLGSWGSGKTSLMRQIDSELKKLRDDLQQPAVHHQVIWVNVWQLSPKADIAQSFLQSVLSQVKKHLP